jgi:hypothetical protein
VNWHCVTHERFAAEHTGPNYPTGACWEALRDPRAGAALGCRYVADSDDIPPCLCKCFNSHAELIGDMRVMLAYVRRNGADLEEIAAWLEAKTSNHTESQGEVTK